MEYSGRRSTPDTFKVGKLLYAWRMNTNDVRMICRDVEEENNVPRLAQLKLWHLWAYKGVADMLQAYIKHKESVVKAK